MALAFIQQGYIKYPKLLLTHWGRVTHIHVGNLAIFDTHNGLSPGRRQAIIRTIAGILLIGTLGTNVSDALIEIHIFSFKKLDLKIPSENGAHFFIGFNVLNDNSKRKVSHRIQPL